MPSLGECEANRTTTPSPQKEAPMKKITKAQATKWAEVERGIANGCDLATQDRRANARVKAQALESAAYWDQVAQDAKE